MSDIEQQRDELKLLVDDWYNNAWAGLEVLALQALEVLQEKLEEMKRPDAT